MYLRIIGNRFTVKPFRKYTFGSVSYQAWVDAFATAGQELGLPLDDDAIHTLAREYHQDPRKSEYTLIHLANGAPHICLPLPKDTFQPISIWHANHRVTRHGRHGHSSMPTKRVAKKTRMVNVKAV